MKPLAAADPGKIGTFRTIAALGSGAMGRVLLGRQAHGELVAIKRVHSGFAEDAGFRRRFEREVTASREVSGPHIAKVIAADTDARVPWMATEYVPGLTLQEAVDEAGPLTEEAVFRLAAGLAAALTGIHRAKLVHRDLKPSNIMLTRDGLKVIDFGIARAVDASTLTSTGTVIGSYAFMSPEQILADEAVPASDVFALGAVLGFAATGRGPFDASTVPAITHRIVNAEPRLDGVAADLREYIEECLVKNPDDRPGAAAVLDSIPQRFRESAGPDGRPWGQEVCALIDTRLAAIDGFIARTHTDDTVVDPAATNIPEAAARAETRVQTAAGPKKPPRRKPPKPRAAAYVRELAEKLDVDLATVTPTGSDGSIRSQDVRDAASSAATQRAEARAREQKAKAKAADRRRAAEAARRKLKQGPESAPPSKPATKSPSVGGGKKKNEDWKVGLGILGTIFLVLVVIGAISEGSEDDSGSGSGSDDSTTTAARNDTGTGFDDAADSDTDDAADDYDPPTTESEDPTAGCSEAFDSINTQLDIANPALESGDTAGAIGAFRDLASGLRVAESLAENVLVETNIGILAADSDKMADALVSQDNTYDYWREVWTGDRDDLRESCYG